MIDKDLQKFMKTGQVKDYLAYKKKQKMEASKELSPEVKNETKRGNNR